MQHPSHVIALLSILTPILEEQEDKLAEARTDADHAAQGISDTLDRLHDTENRYATLVQENQDLRQTISNLQRESRDLRQEHNISRYFSNKAELLDAIMSNPIAFGRVLDYMLQGRTYNEGAATALPGGQMISSHKIEVIRHVREVGQWGLREARTFVENYRPVSMVEAPTLPESNDGG